MRDINLLFMQTHPDHANAPLGGSVIMCENEQA